MNSELVKLKSMAASEGWDEYIRTQNDERALLAGCRFKPALGYNVCNFIENELRHSVGRWAGKPFKLMEWQKRDIIIPLFSWVRPSPAPGPPHWIRRFKSAMIWVPKKNGKSELVGALVTAHLIADNEPGAQVYLAANSREQAGIVFRSAAALIESSPKLSSVFRVNRGSKSIFYGRDSWIKTLSSEHTVSEGWNASLVVVDELHSFTERGKLLLDTLRYSGAARTQPMFIIISTAGDDVNSVGYEYWEHARNVISGAADDIYTFSYIAAADKGDDWTSANTWRKANPSLGTTLLLDELKTSCDEAKNRPQLQSAFKRYRLNLWTESADPWLDYETWKACADDNCNIDGMYCCIGLDLSSTTDLTAAVIAFMLPEGNVYILPRFWVPGDKIADRELQEHIQYRRLESLGYVRIIDDTRIDYDIVEKDIISDIEKYKCHFIAYDPWGAYDLIKKVSRITGAKTVEYRQTMAGMTNATKGFDSLVARNRLRHNNNPIMNMQAATAEIISDTNGNVKPTKSTRGKKRKHIDGIVAAIMACDAVTRTASKYSDSDTGIVFVDFNTGEMGIA